MKNILLSIGLLLFLSLSLQAQIYEIDAYNNQTVTTCSGSFYDSGGPSGNYTANQTYTITFCPATPNTYIRLVFTQWTLATGASLQVYDGPNTTYNSFGTFSAGGFNPMTMDVIATPTNTSGCLTLVFSAGAATAAGFTAIVECAIPCQTIQAHLFGSSPAVSGGFIDICQGQSIQLSGGGLFPQNNLVYGQSNFDCTFIWAFGDGIVDTTSMGTVSHTYANTGGYNINLTVIDSMGCESTNVLDARVRISTTPIFAGTMPQDSVICAGDQVTLLGNVETVPFEVTADLALAGQTFLPDGSGASYSTSLIFDAFAPGQTVTALSDIVSLCAVMEHSYLGDLDIWLECPNGSIVQFVDYPNGCGGTYLGVPIDVDSNLNPGTGWEYCWSPTATLGTFSAECGGTGTLPAGTYSSLTPWTNFIGCPLNGTWTIGITDNLLSDNGYIFEWGLQFNPNILPSNFNYEPEVTEYEWTNTFGVFVNSSGTNSTIAPPAGSYNYTFTITDDFNCSYDTTVHLTVLPSYHVNFPNDTVLCSDKTLVLDATNNGANSGAIYNWHWDFMDPQIISTNGHYTVTKPGQYYVVIPNIVAQCGYTDTINVVYNEMELDLGNDISNVCSNNLVTLDATTPVAGYAGGVQYLWNTQAITPTITAWSSGTYTVSVHRGTCTEIDTIHVDYDTPISVNLPSQAFKCQGSTFTIQPGWPGEHYLWNTGASTNNLTVSNPGTYTVTISNACGSSSDFIQIIGYTIPTIELGPNLETCQGTSVPINGLYTGPGPQPTYLWSTGETNPVIAGNQQGYYSLTTTNDCGTFSDQVYLSVDQPLQINLGNDTVICAGASLILSVNQPADYYFWSTGSTNDSITVTTADLYTVEAENNCGTYGADITVGISNFQFNLGPDTTFCPGTGVFLHPTVSNPLYYLWSNGSQAATQLISQPGTYSLTATNIYNCQYIDAITISEYNTNLNLGNDTTICDGTPYILNSGISGFPHSWSTGASTQSISITQPGNYSLSINHICGVLTDDVNISVAPSPTVDLGADTLWVSNGSLVTIDAQNQGASYLWSNGATTQTITVSVGTYTVTVTVGGCSDTDKVIVLDKMGIDEPIAKDLVSIYPNPASNSFVIESKSGLIKGYAIYNAIGQSLKAADVYASQATVNAAGIPAGLYFIRLQMTDDTYLIRQLVIKR